MENIFIKKDFEYVKVINGKWTVNEKTFNECSFNERQLIFEKALML